MQLDERIPRTIWWEDGKVYMIDQSRLPLVGDVLECDNHEGVCWAIRGMAVRGAPALGVAAALAIAAWVQNETADIETPEAFFAGLEDVVEAVTSTRPTAVNLFWGAERLRRLAYANEFLPLAELKELIVQEALNMVEEDEERNRVLGQHGAELIKPGSKLLTHCNAGSLATAYFGTALGVIFTAFEQGKVEHVWVDETRPVMQGARLTSWELMMSGISCALITDSMAAWVMAQGAVDAVIVGADRIAANGDTANKIGTYSLAVLAHEHGIPFYVAAPTSTIDQTISTGADIPIEQRNPEEVTGVTWSGVFESPSPEAARALDALTEKGPYEFDIPRGHKLVVARKGGAYQFDGWARIAPVNVPVYNPAFDVTPAKYITAIITERGVAEPDYEMTLGVLCMGSGALHELARD
jgi:methylthioribose-1-phosphate isomerase